MLPRPIARPGADWRSPQERASPTPSMPRLPSERPAVPTRKELVRSFTDVTPIAAAAVDNSNNNALAEVSFELAQTRAALRAAHGARECLARALAEHVARVRGFEELARAACAERDELAARFAQRVWCAESARNDAVRELEMFRAGVGLLSPQSGPPSAVTTPTDEDETKQTLILGAHFDELAARIPAVTDPSPNAMLTPNLTPIIESALPDADEKVYFVEDFHMFKYPSATEVRAERIAIIERLPVPRNAPRAGLAVFHIPPRYTLADVFGHTLGNRMTQIALSGHHALLDVTTDWVTDNNVHGWLFTPLFRCFSLTVAGTFKWVEMDVKSPLDKPTECFLSVKDGNWFYAGIYKGFRMRDVPPDEWKGFSTERKNAIVAETLRERRAVAPQLQLDVRQLYDLGVLRVACIGLQCMGYNQRLYDAVSKHAEKCRRLNQWKGVPFD